MSEIVGHVVALNRYPVKSMQGEQPDEVTFDLNGMVGDRRWAVGVAGDDDAKVLTAKRVPTLLEATATGDGTDAERPTITLPSGRVIEPSGPDADALLSDWLDRPVRLVAADATGGASFDMSFNVDDEDDGMFEMPMPPDRFVDLGAIHLLTTASLATAAEGHPDGDWNPHRFRAGVLIETDPSVTGFPESDWTADIPVRVGGVVVTPVMATVRCAMTTRAQGPHRLDRDLDIFKTIGSVNGGNLGLYGSIAEAGVIRLGDAVTVG